MTQLRDVEPVAERAVAPLRRREGVEREPVASPQGVADPEVLVRDRPEPEVVAGDRRPVGDLLLVERVEQVAAGALRLVVPAELGQHRHLPELRAQRRERLAEPLVRRAGARDQLQRLGGTATEVGELAAQVAGLRGDAARADLLRRRRAQVRDRAGPLGIVGDQLLGGVQQRPQAALVQVAAVAQQREPGGAVRQLCERRDQLERAGAVLLVPGRAHPVPPPVGAVAAVGGGGRRSRVSTSPGSPATANS